jgi:hypothetical protein
MMIPGGNTVRGQLLEPVEGYDMDREGVSAGTFVFSDNLPRYQEMYTFCYSELDKYSHVTFMPEQAVFDFMVQAFDLSPEPLDPKIYTPHPTDTEHAPAAKIIHSYGQPKFWNGQHNAHWDTNYRAWLDMGGSKYVHPNAIDRILDRLRGVRTRLRW